MRVHVRMWMQLHVVAAPSPAVLVTSAVVVAAAEVRLLLRQYNCGCSSVAAAVRWQQCGSAAVEVWLRQCGCGCGCNVQGRRGAALAMAVRLDLRLCSCRQRRLL